MSSLEGSKLVKISKSLPSNGLSQEGSAIPYLGKGHFPPNLLVKML
jgi:hypothetical protein